VRLERGVEWVAKEKIKGMAKRSDLALLMVDAEEGVTDQDAAIASMALDFGMSVIVLFNKMDCLEGEAGEDKRWNLERSRDLKMAFLRWCPQLEISALTGKGLKALRTQIHSILGEREQRVGTGELNRLFEKKFKEHPHPMISGGRIAKFYYMSQVRSSPPEFVLFGNLKKKDVHFSFERYVKNTLRENFGFWGTPIQLHFRKHSR